MNENENENMNITTDNIETTFTEPAVEENTAKENQDQTVGEPLNISENPDTASVQNAESGSGTSEVQDGSQPATETVQNSTQTPVNDPAQDPYSKYIFPGNPGTPGPQGIPENNGYYPRYNGYYPQYTRPYGYPGVQPNPYPNAREAYMNPVDSLYSGNIPNSVKKTKKEKSKAAKFFGGVAMSAAFGLVAAGVFIGITYFYKEKNPELFSSSSTPVQVTTTETKANSRLNLDPAKSTKVPSTSTLSNNVFASTDVAAVVEKAMPSIVSIECVSKVYSYYGTYSGQSAASGIIIQKNDKELIIATNNHVVEDTSKISITFCDGTSAEATIKGTDENNDLAVVSVQLSDLSESTLKAISIATLGNSDETKIGEIAIAIGNSMGYGQSVTVGYISAKDRDLTIDGKTYTDLLQTDAAINHGNSGGALVNLKGEVIGINNAKVERSTVEGMGYAIPISKAQDILLDFAGRELLDETEQGFIGINYQDINETTAAVYDMPVGIYIANIIEDTGAEAAGLQVGDIITKIDGIETKTSQKLLEKLQSTKAGKEIVVTVQRRGEDGEYSEKEFKVLLGNRPVAETKDKKE